MSSTTYITVSRKRFPFYAVVTDADTLVALISSFGVAERIAYQNKGWRVVNLTHPSHAKLRAKLLGEPQGPQEFGPAGVMRMLHEIEDEIVQVQDETFAKFRAMVRGDHTEER